jgi:hypothetical protein
MKPSNKANAADAVNRAADLRRCEQNTISINLNPHEFDRATTALT